MELYHQDSLEQTEKTNTMAEFENFITDLKTQIKDKKQLFGDKASSDGSSAEEDIPKKSPKKKKKKEKPQQQKTQPKEKPRKKQLEADNSKKVKISKTQVVLAEKIIRRHETKKQKDFYHGAQTSA